MSILKFLNGVAVREQSVAYRQTVEDAAPKRNEPKTAAETKRYEAALAIAESNFGCQQENVKKLVGVILGGTLPEIAKSGSEAIPVPDPATIIYNDEVDEIVMVNHFDSDGDIITVRADGSQCSYLEREDYQWRPASDEEINQFINEAGMKE